MLWRLRATLPDRPGALAVLAQECGRAGVNIVALQVFPGAGSVTDELVLEAPEGWRAEELAALVERAGGESAHARPCGEQAREDQPTRYVAAARAVLAAPTSFPEIVATLFDADVVPTAAHQDVMELVVGEVEVQIRREAPFTAIERARGEAMAALVSDVLGRERPAFAPSGDRRLGTGATPAYVTDGPVITALADGVAIGRAVLGEPEAADPATRPVELAVEVSWQRRGVGTRLLGEAVRAARAAGAHEIVLATSSDNRAVMPMVMAAGLRGRIRMAGDRLTVRIAVVEARRR
ncbi:GNAT family N-acetyltransferase [Nocardioides sp.]|uniref:GNAT family N-acetyltransferase n=1 Tax=Nocardioides sp. TaxID=35761 RepID=UPI0035170F16